MATKTAPATALPVSIEDVYAAAMDSIETALSCERSAILLFDAAGIMQFVASRGLSDNYRGAVASP